MAIEKILQVYEKLNTIYLNQRLMCCPQTRQLIKKDLETELGEGFDIKCDEENNPQDIIESQVVVAQVKINRDPFMSMVYNYTNLIFGHPETVAYVQNKFNL